MRTRISKHGKYRIYEGCICGVADSLEPGDILTATLDSVGKVKFEVVNRITNNDEFAQAISLMQPVVALIVLDIYDKYSKMGSLYDRFPYLLRRVSDGSYGMVISRSERHFHVKVKRRIQPEDTITAEKVNEGRITGDCVNTTDDGKETCQFPNRPGLWRDRGEDTWLVLEDKRAVLIPKNGCGSKLFKYCGPFTRVEDEWHGVRNVEA